MCYIPKNTNILKNNIKLVNVHEITNVTHFHTHDSDNNEDEYLHMFKVTICLLIYGIVMSKFILYLKI